jgi:hypothetical protein
MVFASIEDPVKFLFDSSSTWGHRRGLYKLLYFQQEAITGPNLLPYAPSSGIPMASFVTCPASQNSEPNSHDSLRTWIRVSDSIDIPFCLALMSCYSMPDDISFHGHRFTVCCECHFIGLPVALRQRTMAVVNDRKETIPP